MRFEIAKKFKIDVAHAVTTQTLHRSENEICKRLHGHTVTVETLIVGKLSPINNMVIDYTLLDNFKKFLDTYFDHHLILGKNDIEKLPIKIDMNNFEDEQIIYLPSYIHCSNALKFKHNSKERITILPIQTTTAELLSWYLSIVLLGSLISDTNPILCDDFKVKVRYYETPNTYATPTKWFKLKYNKPLIYQFAYLNIANSNITVGFMEKLSEIATENDIYVDINELKYLDNNRDECKIIINKMIKQLTNYMSDIVK